MAVCQCGRTVKPIEPVGSCNRNSQMAHVEKINSSVGLVRGAEKNMQLLGAVQGKPIFNSQAGTTICLTGYTELHSAAARAEVGLWEGSAHGHRRTKQTMLWRVMPLRVLVLWFVKQ